MNTSIIQSKSRYQNGINIHLLSFALPKNIIKDNEEIRVSVTSIPEENKQSFFIEGKNMSNANHVFSLNITDQTKKILIVFRKKTFFFDSPVIASTIVHLVEFDDIPNQQMTNAMVTTEIRSFNIYYPLKLQREEEKTENIQRKVLGVMNIQLTFLSPYIIQDHLNNNKMHQINKVNKGQKKKYNKNNRYDKLLESNSF